MPDLLTHVLFAYAVFTLASIRYDWLTPEYVTLGLAGAVVPDLSKLYLLVGSDSVAELLGLPFDWFGIHTLGGVVVIAVGGALLFARRHRRRALVLVIGGAATHLVLDAGIREPTGHGYAALWPITRYHLPSPNLYLSTDAWPAVVAMMLALAAFLLRRYPRGPFADTP